MERTLQTVWRGLGMRGMRLAQRGLQLMKGKFLCIPRHSNPVTGSHIHPDEIHAAWHVTVAQVSACKAEQCCSTGLSLHHGISSAVSLQCFSTILVLLSCCHSCIEPQLPSESCIATSWSALHVLNQQHSCVIQVWLKI